MIYSAEEFVRLRNSEDPDEYLAAAWDEAPISVWMDVINKYPDMRFWVAQNKTVPVEILRILSDDSEWRVRDMVASKNKISEEIQLKLATDKEFFVRKSIACNKKATLKDLQLLSLDEEKEIKEIAQKRITEKNYK